MSKNKTIFHAGEKVSNGFYTCVQCGEEVVSISPDTAHELPVCPNCNGDLWYKI